MSTKTVWVLLPVAVTSAFTVLAADKRAGPPAELSQLSVPTGTWICRGTGVATPTRRGPVCRRIEGR